MTKEETIKKLTELKNESEDYSKYALMNEGYRVAMIDAIDLVKKLNIGSVVGQSEQLCKHKRVIKSQLRMVDDKSRYCMDCQEWIV
jgi:hypothetical protein